MSGAVKVNGSTNEPTNGRTEEREHDQLAGLVVEVSSPHGVPWWLMHPAGAEAGFCNAVKMMGGPKVAMRVRVSTVRVQRSPELTTGNPIVNAQDVAKVRDLWARLDEAGWDEEDADEELRKLHEAIGIALEPAGMTHFRLMAWLYGDPDAVMRLAMILKRDAHEAQGSGGSVNVRCGVVTVDVADNPSAMTRPDWLTYPGAVRPGMEGVRGEEDRAAEAR